MRLNRNQLVVLWCGIALIAVMCLYVPWHQSATVFKAGGGEEIPHSPEDCGYGLIFLLKGGQPPDPKDEPLGCNQRIDAGRLGIQCGLVALITAGLLVTFRDPVKRP